MHYIPHCNEHRAINVADNENKVGVGYNKYSYTASEYISAYDGI